MSVYVADRLGRAKWNVLPKVAIESIANHMYMDYLARPPELSEGVPFFRGPDTRTLSNAMRLYFLMIFSQRLEDLTVISEKWAAVVSNHPIHREICQIIACRSFSIKSKAAQPTNRDLARQYCWICSLNEHSLGSDDGSNDPPATAVTYGCFANVGIVPVCQDHSEMDICQHCLAEDDLTADNGDVLNLLEMKESETYGLSRAQICEACRREAIYRQESMAGVSLDWSRAGPAWRYVEWGLGSVDEAVEGILVTLWLERNHNFRRLRSDMLLQWKKDKANYKAEDRAEESTEWRDGGGCTEIELREITKELIRQDAYRLVHRGMWILPDLNNRPAPQSGHTDTMELHQPGEKLAAPLGDTATCTRNIVDHIPWTGAPYTLLQGYFSQVETHIWVAVKGPLIELRNMLLATQIGASGSAGERAEQMTEDELVGWLQDPRLYVSDWWAPSHTSVSEGSDGKRRRTDDDDENDGRLRKLRRLDESRQIRLGDDIPAASDAIMNKRENHASVSVTPRPKDALDTTDYYYYTQHLADKPRNPLTLPTNRYQMPPAVKQIIRSCWMSITKDMRKCKCGICSRRDRQERAEVEARQRQRDEEKMKRELDAQKLRQMKMMLQASRQAIPSMTATDTGITTIDASSPDSFDLLGELSEIENDAEMLSEDDSYDDECDEEEETT